MEAVIRTRRQWLRAAATLAASSALRAERKEFWDSKDPGGWSEEEKQVLLRHSPWAQEGVAKMEVGKKRTTAGYGNNGRQGVAMPDTRPGSVPGGVKSVPIGEDIPPVPDPDPIPKVDFRVLARWESAKPVRLAGGPEVPEMTGQFYVIRLRGLPLMPLRKPKPGAAAVNPNEGMLQAIKAESRLERKGKPGIPCAHLFTGSADAANDVLLYFPRGADPITAADKSVTLESRFGVFHLTVKFPLKDMTFQGALAL